MSRDNGQQNLPQPFNERAGALSIFSNVLSIGTGILSLFVNIKSLTSGQQQNERMRIAAMRNSSTMLFDQGVRHANDGHYHLAANAMDHAIKEWKSEYGLNGDRVRASEMEFQMAVFLFVKEDYKEAKKYLDKSIERDGDSIKAYNLHAIISWLEGDFRDAEKYFLKSLSLEPNQPLVSLLVNVLNDRADYSDLQKVLPRGKGSFDAIAIPFVYFLYARYRNTKKFLGQCEMYTLLDCYTSTIGAFSKFFVSHSTLTQSYLQRAIIYKKLSNNPDREFKDANEYEKRLMSEFAYFEGEDSLLGKEFFLLADEELPEFSLNQIGDSLKDTIKKDRKLKKLLKRVMLNKLCDFSYFNYANAAVDEDAEIKDNVRAFVKALNELRRLEKGSDQYRFLSKKIAHLEMKIQRYIDRHLEDFIDNRVSQYDLKNWLRINQQFGQGERVDMLDVYAMLNHRRCVIFEPMRYGSAHFDFIKKKDQTRIYADDICCVRSKNKLHYELKKLLFNLNEMYEFLSEGDQKKLPRAVFLRYENLFSDYRRLVANSVSLFERVMARGIQSGEEQPELGLAAAEGVKR